METQAAIEILKLMGTTSIAFISVTIVVYSFGFSRLLTLYDLLDTFVEKFIQLSERKMNELKKEQVEIDFAKEIEEKLPFLQGVPKMVREKFNRLFVRAFVASITASALSLFASMLGIGFAYEATFDPAYLLIPPAIGLIATFIAISSMFRLFIEIIPPYFPKKRAKSQ